MRHLYNEAFFDWFVPHRGLYQPVADWLKRYMGPDSVLDLGCGNGFFLDMIGAPVSVGVEYTVAGINAMPSLGVQRVLHDLCDPLDLGRLFDLVICTEVAEHLPKHAAGTLVETVARHASRWVLFSAAQPGQGGEGHLNEQPLSYWRGLFTAAGFREQEALTEAVRRIAPFGLSWIASNALVFKYGR